MRMTPASSPSDDIPTFRIELARPPELRYYEVATEFGSRMRSMSLVFDELLRGMLGYRVLAVLAKLAARLFLRRLYDVEQTKEVTAIAKVARLDLYLIIALNVFLDILMGCTAGCVTVQPQRLNGGALDGSLRLMHFRTLDWGMDALRDLLVRLEYVDSSTGSDRVIATTVTYAGFVGTLTGVRENLSISLNYRPTHLCPTWELTKHQILVLLGFRPSISFILHKALFNPETQTSMSDLNSHTTSIVTQANSIASIFSSPCYLTLCDGKQAAVIEKDLMDGRIKITGQYIVQTNHDSDHSKCCGDGKKFQAMVLGNEIWRQDSTQRQDHMLQGLMNHGRCAVMKPKAFEEILEKNGACINSKLAANNETATIAVTEDTLRTLMADEAISTSFTHFACIMDPQAGKIRWLRRGPDPRIEHRSTQPLQ